MSGVFSTANGRLAITSILVVEEGNGF